MLKAGILIDSKYLGTSKLGHALFCTWLCPAIIILGLCFTIS
jgi:hypothetical protein